MKIDLHNYEELLLDYFDGKLDKEMQVELHSFLSEHPELEISLSDLDLPVLEKEVVSVKLGEELMKFQTHDQEEICRYVDGLMNAAERVLFEKRVKSDPKFATELSSFRKTILRPDEIYFGHKQALKRDRDPVLDNKAIEYVEGLLSESESAVVAASAEFQKEITLLQLTKLSADPAIFFENKKALKRSGRVIPLFSVRTISAAAAVFLIVLLSVIYVLIAEKDSAPLAVKKDGNLNKVMINTPSQKTEVSHANHAQTEPVVASNAGVMVKTPAVVRAKKVVQAEEERFTSSSTNDSAPAMPAVDTAALLAENLETQEENNDYIIPAKPDSSENRRTILSFSDLPVVEDDLVYTEEQNNRGSLWQRLTRLAGEANRLGVKAVDGEIRDDEGFRLSINSISIEKK